MKKITKLALVSSAVVLGTAAALAVGYTAMKNRNVALPEGFTVTAHTGCEGTADNSLEAIRKGYDSGADIVEFDLHFNNEGVPVLAHDGAEKDSVTLDEAFALIAELEGLKVNVDCKTTLNLTAVADLAEKYGVKDRIFYTGISEKDVPAVKEQTPDIEYYLNAAIDKSKKHNEEYLEALADKTAELGAVGINLYFGDCSKKLVKVFREKGLLVSIWTVNTEFDMVRTLELGADNITTRKPTRLKEIIKLKTSA